MSVSDWPIAILTLTHLLKEKASRISAVFHGDTQDKCLIGDIIFQLSTKAKETVFETCSKRLNGNFISLRKLLIYEGFGDDGDDAGFVTAEEDFDEEEISVATDESFYDLPTLPVKDKNPEVQPIQREIRNDVQSIRREIRKKERPHEPPSTNLRHLINGSQESKKKAKERLLAELSQDAVRQEPKRNSELFVKVSPHREGFQKNRSMKAVHSGVGESVKAKEEVSVKQPIELRHMINARKVLVKKETESSILPSKSLETEKQPETNCVPESIVATENPHVDADDDTKSDDQESQDHSDLSPVLEYDQDTMPALAVVKELTNPTIKRPTQVMWKDTESELTLTISFRDCDLTQDLIKNCLHLNVEEQAFSLEYMENLYSLVSFTSGLMHQVVPCKTNHHCHGLNLTVYLKKQVPRIWQGSSPFMEDGHYLKKHWIVHDPMDFECNEEDQEEKEQDLPILPWMAQTGPSTESVSEYSFLSLFSLLR